MAKRSNAGGGLGSRVVKNNQAGRKVEPRAQGIRPGAVSQIGQSLGTHAQEAGAKKLDPIVPTRTQGYNAPVGAQTNAKPTIHATGTQAQHESVAGSPKPEGRDILGAFGSESPNVRARR
jgi:hypothetical protein